MAFKDYKYERPNYQEVKVQLTSLIEEFTKAANAEEQFEYIKRINKIRNRNETMYNLAYIRHTINTQDKYYDEENNYWNEHSPLYEELNSEFYKALVNSKFRQALEEKLGKQFFTLAEFTIKSFSVEIIEDLQRENKLVSQYVKLIASAKINFQGEERTLSTLPPFTLSKDRVIREKASKAKYDFFLEKEAEIDRIYDELVKVRTKIAKKLGFKNFVESLRTS